MPIILVKIALRIAIVQMTPTVIILLESVQDSASQDIILIRVVWVSIKGAPFTGLLVESIGKLRDVNKRSQSLAW